MKLNFNNFFPPNFKKRFFLMSASILLMGVFLSLLITVGWGTDTCSFMNLNVSSTLGMSFGTWQFLLNAVILVFIVFTHWELIGFGTIFNMTLIGYTADFCRWMISHTSLEDVLAANFGLKVTFFVVSLLCFVFTAAVYMNSELGLSPFDAVSFILSKKLSKIPFFLVRIIYDLTVILIGIGASAFNPNGMQGSVPGVIVLALTIGPAVSVTGRLVRKIL